ncbi:hypothetical protein [Deinococcus multiflagellatus]|uniref:Uncharacterized protein n=1 Tax=Deinococcus multiflagellatus TaxID=1656887 RepID=A0ABW1ZVC9_9DEIO|nr:hypothetical protein [Deinococcus multiflagellatus]MBZ9714446.1 hypothetical protein [Deinococcus multiflagellatus]
MTAERREKAIKWVLLANAVLGLLIMLYATGAALGTGLILGGINFNLSLTAYLIHRNGRVIQGLTGVGQAP